MTDREPGRPASRDRRIEPVWRLLPAVLALAFAARVAVVLGGDFIYHPDVVFQYLEPAWRLVSGHGLIVWEQFYGARPQLIPVALAGAMQALLTLGVDHPTALRTGVELALCGVSLLVPWGMYAFARAAFDETMGRVALVLGAAWYELAALAGQPLSETLALCPLLWTLALAARADTRTRAWGVGLLAAATLALRFQYAPVAMLAVALAWPRMRESGVRRHVLAAAAVGMALVAVFDAATVGLPIYRSYVANMAFNLAYSEVVLAAGGVPWYFYLLALALASGGLLFVLFVAAALGLGPLPRPYEAYLARSLKWLLAPLLLALATHTLPAWKEYRYVLVAVPFWLTGLALVATVLWRRGSALPRTAAGLLGAWFAAATAAGVSFALPGQPSIVHGPGSPVPLAFVGAADPRLEFAGRMATDPTLVGVAQIGLVAEAGLGHVHLGRPVPIHDSVTIAALSACGLAPDDYATHAVVPPGEPLPAGFDMAVREPGGWRLATRSGAGPPPHRAVPGPVRLSSSFDPTARSVFEAGAGDDRAWPARLWKWWASQGEAPPFVPAFRVPGRGSVGSCGST